jgi:hypothetical protein
MLTLWSIKILNAVFVWSLGVTVIWLLCCSLMVSREAKKASAKSPALLLDILKEGVPYLRMPLKKYRYSLGRDERCDVLLRGSGIPARAGEISILDGGCFFEQSHRDRCGERIALIPGQDLALYNFSLRIEAMERKEG